MVLPVLRLETIRQAAIVRLRAAVAAANEEDADPSALKDLYVPKHRFEKLKPERAPFVHVVAKSDNGAGNSRLVPQFDLVGTLHFNVFHANTRQHAADLDLEAAQVAEAICLTILEDGTFLGPIGWISGLRIDIDDGIARGDQGSEYDCVLVQIELEISGDQKIFEPVAGVPLRTITTRMTQPASETELP